VCYVFRVSQTPEDSVQAPFPKHETRNSGVRHQIATDAVSVQRDAALLLLRRLLAQHEEKLSMEQTFTEVDAFLDEVLS
jgi:hypothetical protein